MELNVTIGPNTVFDFKSLRTIKGQSFSVEVSNGWEPGIEWSQNNDEVCDFIVTDNKAEILAKNSGTTVVRFIRIEDDKTIHKFTIEVIPEISLNPLVTIEKT